MATFTNHNIENLAIGCTIWKLSISEAKSLRKWFKENVSCDQGTYWWSNFVSPVNRAVRSKSETVSIRTAGFTTGEFRNYLHNADITV